MSSLWIPAPASASQTPKASVNPISSTEQRSDTGFRCHPVICPHCFPSCVASEINVASSGKSQPARPARETQGSSTRRMCPQGRGSQEPPFTHSLPRGLGHVPSQGHKPGAHQLPERRFLGPDDLRGSEQCISEKRLELRPPGGKAQVPGSHTPAPHQSQHSWPGTSGSPRSGSWPLGPQVLQGLFGRMTGKERLQSNLHTRAQQGCSSRVLHSLSESPLSSYMSLMPVCSAHFTTEKKSRGGFSKSAKR